MKQRKLVLVHIAPAKIAASCERMQVLQREVGPDAKLTDKRNACDEGRRLYLVLHPAMVFLVPRNWPAGVYHLIRGSGQRASVP